MLNILKAFFKTGLGSLGVITFGVISTKIFALLIGVEGVGLLSVLRQFKQTGFSLASLSGETALVQGIASNNVEKRLEFIKTVFLLFISASFLVCGIIIVFAPKIAVLISTSPTKSLIELVRWMSIPISLFAILAFFKSVLNGFKAIGRLAVTSIIYSMAIALLAYPVSLFINKGYDIAFVWMMIIAYSISLIAVLIFLYRAGWLSEILSGLKFYPWAIKHFFTIAFAMMVTGLAHSGVLLIVKGWIIKESGFYGVGIFEASWTISIVYIGLLTKSFSTYYLPSLSEIIKPDQKVLFIRNIFRLVVLFLVPSVVVIIVLKGYIIRLLYSDEFLAANSIMRWLLIGDYFKVSSWVLTFPMLAYMNMKIFLLSGIVWWFLFGSLSYLSIFYFNNIEGIGFTYMILYIAYYIFSIIYIRAYHKFSFTYPMIFQWVVGIVIIMGVSFSTWNTNDLAWVQIIFWGCILLLYLWFVITKDEKSKIKKYLMGKYKKIVIK